MSPCTIVTQHVAFYVYCQCISMAARSIMRAYVQRASLYTSVGVCGRVKKRVKDYPDRHPSHAILDARPSNAFNPLQPLLDQRSADDRKHA